PRSVSCNVGSDHGRGEERPASASVATRAADQGWPLRSVRQSPSIIFPQVQYRLQWAGRSRLVSIPPDYGSNLQRGCGLSAVSFDKADDRPAGPAGDAFAGRIVMPVQNARLRDVHPGVGWILPSGELAADKGLEMAVNDAVLHCPAG